MNAVIAWMLSMGLKVRRGVAPAASVTSIVSPMARENARMNDAMMPEKAAGTTTRREHLQARAAERVRRVAKRTSAPRPSRPR